MRILLSAVIWDESFKTGMRQSELIAYARRFGCCGLEFRPFWRDERPEVAGLAEQMASESFSTVYACGDALLARTETDTAAGLAAMSESLELAKGLGAELLRIFPAHGPFDAGKMKAGWWRDETGRLAQRAKESGIVLAVENPGAREAGGPDLIRELTGLIPGLRLTYDTGNWLSAGHDPAEALEQLMDVVGYVHLKDMKRAGSGFSGCRPGSGSIDIRGLVQRLEDSGYDGLYALEYSGGQEPEASVEAALAYLRQENG